MTKASAKVAEPEKAAKPKPPERSAEELERMIAARERTIQRHEPVTVDIGREADGRLTVGCPHDDGRGWLIRMQDAFGTRSDTVALGRLVELTGLVRESSGRPSSEVNTMLAAVDAVRPENDTEGMLAVQMAATHHVAMENLQRSARASTLELMEAHGNLANKLLRTYTAQIEALAKLRRGGSQKVTVEHVHVYEGGQAIVGNVETGARSAPGRGRGQREKEHQPHELTGPAALAFQADPSLLCPDAGRDPVPVAGREREDEVPQARRRGG